MVYDAGDTLEVLQRCNVDLVLSGREHVPTPGASRNMSVVDAGTVCTLRLRGDTRPCYNIVTIDDDHVRVDACPFHGGDDHPVARPSTLHYQRFASRPTAPSWRVTPRSRGREGAFIAQELREPRRRALPPSR